MRLLATVAASAAILASALGLASTARSLPSPDRCTEDMTCWIPAFDGNGRGSVVFSPPAIP